MRQLCETDRIGPHELIRDTWHFTLLNDIRLTGADVKKTNVGLANNSVARTQRT